MTSLEDFQGFQQEFDRERERLEEADIDDRDRMAIARFLDRKLADLAVSSLAQYGTTMRKAAERSPTPLVDLDEDGFWKLRSHLLRQHSLNRQTVHNYMVAVRRLCNFHGHDWPDEIEISAPDPPAIDPDNMLAQEDIKALRDAATRNRDIALIEFLADTGARLSLVGSLRVGDVELETDTPFYRPNPNAIGLKGAAITRYPIIDSKGALRTYLNHTHPRPDDHEVALFHRVVDANHKLDDDDDGSLSPQTIRRSIRQPAEKIDLDKPVNPHNFRHSAISRMDREGFDRSEIEHRVHWDIDSDMWERYLHLKTEQLNADIYAKAGLDDSGRAQSSRREECPNCRETIPPYGEYCPTCAEPITHDARERQSDFEDAAIDALADQHELSPRERRIVKASLDLARNDDDVIPAHDSSTSSTD
jgi:integrase